MSAVGHPKVDVVVTRLERELRRASLEDLRRTLERAEAAARLAPDPSEWERTLNLIRWELRRRSRVAS